MKKQILLLVFTGVFLVLTSACKKDVQSTIAGTVESQLLDKINRVKGTKGGVTLVSKEQVSRYAGNSKAYQLDGAFEGLPFDDVRVNDITLEPLQNRLPQYESNQYVPTKETRVEQITALFGKRVNVSYQPKGGGVSLRDAAFIDVEGELGFNVPPSSTGSTTTYRNVPLSWSAGSSSNKVYILISFDPESVSNSSFRNYSPISRFAEVSDNGSYTLTESSFSGIPVGAYFIIAVARGNTAVAAGGTTGNSSITSMSVGTAVGQVGGGGGGGGGDSGTIHIQ